MEGGQRGEDENGRSEGKGVGNMGPWGRGQEVSRREGEGEGRWKEVEGVGSEGVALAGKCSSVPAV